jgi:hypothetical protein
MQLCCPTCGTEFPIEAGWSEADGKRLAALTAGIDPVVARPAMQYLRLFKPAKTALRIPKAMRLLEELAALIATGRVCRDERGGVERPAKPAHWAAGMEQMVERRSALSLPLDNHNYLRAVVFGIADFADATAERAREDAARNRGASSPAPTTSAAVAPDTENPFQKKLAWIEQQLRYGAIDQAEADRQIAELRSLPRG